MCVTKTQERISPTNVEIKFFVNGTKVSTMEVDYEDADPSRAFMVGYFDNTAPGGSVFDGEISDVQLYDRTLSESEVENNFIAVKDKYGL
jgi:hypothetical protein